ncbi:MAG: flagellar basal body P-ring protein FlgI [Gammaproteobacteria bacterium]|nr:MAG: flagellar basal body P-ring protein FlgI [Gammaproteobacteria bacterium]
MVTLPSFNKRLIRRVSLMLSLLLMSQSVFAERIKDLATIGGVRDNQLVGYGLVVGLNGTGDKTTQSPFTVQSFKSMLTQFGIVLPAGSKPQMKNIAAVTVHGTLPAFAKPGQAIDITVSSIGNASSLRGGSLLMAPMKGADGKLYAIAQGNLIVGGFGASANDGSQITVNIPSVGRIPNGAIIERAVPNGFLASNFLTLNLNTPDYTTATRVALMINRSVGPSTALAVDGVSVKVSAPLDLSQRVAFVSLLENLTVNPGEAPARVIINSRTGTVVIGRHVRVDRAAVSHGSLTVTITEDARVSQPAPFAAGQTTVVQASDITITEEGKRMFLFKPGITLEELVRAVNKVGAAPGDLVAILEALKQAGALRAELVVI